MKAKNENGAGFTLIELLVVIAIIAILSVVVILTLNPAELLRQSRDSNRISDMSVTKSGISFYLASVSSPYIGSSTVCYQDASGTNATVGTSTIACSVFFTSLAGPASSSVYGSSTAVNGTGWIPINFTSITAGGSPLGSLPHDPVNNDGIHFYAYAVSSTGLVFKLDAHMESLKYSARGTNDVVSTDGGVDTSSYEVGSSLTGI